MAQDTALIQHFHKGLVFGISVKSRLLSMTIRATVVTAFQGIHVKCPLNFSNIFHLKLRIRQGILKLTCQAQGIIEITVLNHLVVYFLSGGRINFPFIFIFIRPKKNG